MSETYTCAKCNNEYDKGWSDEEAMAETDANFPDRGDKPLEVVCDPCYQKMIEQVPPPGAKDD